jgi:hypothetical protein
LQAPPSEIDRHYGCQSGRRTEDGFCRQTVCLLEPTRRPFDPISDRLSASLLAICQTNCPARIRGLCGVFAPAATRRLDAFRIGGGNDFTQTVIIQQDLRPIAAGFTGRTNRFEDDSEKLQVVVWLWTWALFSDLDGNERASRRRRRKFVVGLVPRGDRYRRHGLHRVGMPHLASNRDDLIA